MNAATIPEDVTNTPTGPNGNGFIVLGMLASSIVGSDGECYTRKNGVVTIASEEDEH